MVRKITFYLSSFAALLMLTLTSGAVAQENLIVEISGLPAAYSVRSAAIEPVLAKHSALRLRSYRRLRFAEKADELSYAIKTGNAPDVLSLSYTEYIDRAQNGDILDLSRYLLRMSADDAEWTAQLDFGEALLRDLLIEGKIYAFPGRKRIHGVVLRRDLLESGDSVDELTVRRVGQIAAGMATKMPREKVPSGIAVPLTAENVIYWAMADFGCNWSHLPQASEADGGARYGVAAAALQNTYDSLLDILHRGRVACQACDSVGFARDGLRGVCRDCGGVTLAWANSGPAGRIVSSVEDGLDLFAEGDVGMVMCTRDDLLRLIDRGYPPDKMLFVPLAGAEVVPDVELFALYSGVVDRTGGQKRADELAAFLTTYSTQFLLPPDSPIYLWYERNVIGPVVRRGYGAMYARSERAACIGFPIGNADSGSTLSDAAIQYTSVLPVPEFLALAELSLRDLHALTDALRNGSHLSEGYSITVQRSRDMRISPRSGRVICLLLLVVIVVLAGSVVTAGGNRGFRAYVHGAPIWLILCGAPLLLAVFIRFGGLLSVTVLRLAGGVTGRSCDPEAVGHLAGVILSSLGQGVFSVLVCLALGLTVSVALALMFSRFKGWRVVLGFLLVLPVCLLGLWGSLLCDSVTIWLLGSTGRSGISGDGGMEVLLRSIPAVWGAMPFACMAYVYRLRRVDKALRDAVVLDGGGPADIFFLVTLPALEPVLKLHGLVLACIAMWSTGATAVHVNGSIGSKLLRSLLFGDSPYEVALLCGLLLSFMLLVSTLGIRWIKSIEFRRVYGRHVL